MLGFEIELLVLVDADGRTVLEKVPLGTCGNQQVTLTIDHSSQVETAAPVPAARAPRRLAPYRNCVTSRSGAPRRGKLLS